jgi:predicted nucleotidyltransferase
VKTNQPVITTSGKKHKLSTSEEISLRYHDIFDYPLTPFELIRWETSKFLEVESRGKKIVKQKKGYFFLAGREALIYKRFLRKRASDRKMVIAKNAARVISLIPTVKTVGITGSLAMENSDEEGDIDFMIISSKNSLWLTRAAVYLLLSLTGIKIRRPGEIDQKDKLCLNMWFEEGYLSWKEKNLYSSHEIAQIVPLVDKDHEFDKFLWANKWVLNWWPNSVRIKKPEIKSHKKLFNLSLLNSIAYNFQRRHMKSKLTREKVSLKRAIFHPFDWGTMVNSKLSS